MPAGAWPAAAAATSAAVRAAMRTVGGLLPLAHRPHPTTTAAASSSSSHTLHDYNRLLAALARDGDGDGALRVLRRMRLSSSPACAPTAASYTSAMSALAKADRPADAASLFDDMLSHGVAPDRAAFSLLLHVYSSHLHLPAAAHSVLLWMSRLGLPPTPIDYTDLIFSFCRAGRLADALQLLDEMRALNYPLTPHTFAPILQAFCENADIQAADILISSMRCSGCHPDVVIYNIYIQGLCKMGDFDAVERVIDESARNGWVPDAVTYSTYVAGLCRFRYIEKAFQQLEIMVAKGLQLTVVGLNILLDYVAQDLDMWAGKEVLERCQELGFVVDVVTYNTVMDHFCKKGKWLRVLKLFTDLLKKPITPNVQTYNIFISCLCRAGKFQFAKFVFSSKGFVADTVTCNILIHEFYEARKEAELGFLFSDVNAGKIAPDTITYNTLVDCLFRSGRRLDAANFVRHIDDGYPSEPVARLTYWLVRSGNTCEVLRLFDDIQIKGRVLDSRIFANVIKAFCRKGPAECSEMSQLCSILDRMLGIG
ncbi:pentatricopeptide repeat-containing protein At1g63080, mitochondrial-like [Phragmites australis]|uniref:pentatricopeptide repeat-containing protein At1g63080, mitochondrial-like n=1 Tax=Phragmites australis TaxID=29695 RepID=UPI002D76A2EC|nr:pentatricopeptide repeat-containing protein At1g63080, mitochondrial-like [Phragmites australis]